MDFISKNSYMTQKSLYNMYAQCRITKKIYLKLFQNLELQIKFLCIYINIIFFFNSF
jgi:hypothetical protein